MELAPERRAGLAHPLSAVDENHQAEQYFFDDATLDALAARVQQAERPALVCTPLLGRRLWEAHRRAVPVLDVDRRFADLPGFVEYDLHRPRPLDEKPDLIVCDPPFFNISLSRLFKALRVLAHHDVTTALMVFYLRRRASAVEGTFAAFGLRATDLRAGYRTVQDTGPGQRNEIVAFANCPVR